MSLVRWHYQPRGSEFHRDARSSHGSNGNMSMRTTVAAANDICNYDNHVNYTKLVTSCHDFFRDFSQNYILDGPKINHAHADHVPSSKRRKVTNFSHGSSARPYQPKHAYNDLVNNNDQLEYLKYHKSQSGAPLVCYTSFVDSVSNGVNSYASIGSKRNRSWFEDDEVVFMSRDEIERCSPSRKDGIDPLHEAHLRYSYCAFLQNVGMKLYLPQTTIGTAMVLCHRFFVRRSHASHDRFLVAVAVLFLASKSEETPRPLNDLLRVSCEILYKQDMTFLSYILPIDWFEQYRERIIEAEQLVLTTLNFELNVQHPYESLTSTLQKLGLSQSLVVRLALNLVSEGLACCKPFTLQSRGDLDLSLEGLAFTCVASLVCSFKRTWRGLRSSLWLQFKPHQIAAGAAYLAAKYLNMNLASCHTIWNEFDTPPSVLKDVAHQLMELF